MRMKRLVLTTVLLVSTTVPGATPEAQQLPKSGKVTGKGKGGAPGIIAGTNQWTIQGNNTFHVTAIGKTLASSIIWRANGDCRDDKTQPGSPILSRQMVCGSFRLPLADNSMSAHKQYSSTLKTTSNQAKPTFSQRSSKFGRLKLTKWLHSGPSTFRVRDKAALLRSTVIGLR